MELVPQVELVPLEQLEHKASEELMAQLERRVPKELQVELEPLE